MSRQTDGSVVIKVITDDKQAQQFLKTLKEIDKLSKNVGKGSGQGGKNLFSDIPGKTEKASSGFSTLTKSILASNVAMKALNVVTDSFGTAMGRFDTMKRFPKMMEQMGFSSEQSERSIRKLSKGIEGLPTRLDEVVSTTQNLATMTGDLNKATDLTLALNNAFLASGSSSMDASRGLVQFTQMLSNGKVDLQSWKTLQETMPIGLQKTAEAFGYAGQSAKQELYDALKFGSITFDQFSDKLMELNNGVGGFAELAKTGSEGIQTSFQNVKTAVVNGLSNIITKVDEIIKRATGNNVAKNLDNLKLVVKAVFNAINNALEFVSPLIELFIKGLVKLFEIAIKLIPVLESLGAGFLTFMVIQKVPVMIASLSSTLETLQIAALYAKDGWAKLMTAIVSHPFIAAAVAIATVGYAIFKWFKKTSPEVDEFADKVDKSTQEVKDLKDAMAESEENFTSSKNTIKANADAMKKTAESAFELANRQKRSAGDTKKLKDAIGELNGYFGENIIKIDENTKKLNVNTEAMDAYLKSAEKEKELEAIKERGIELSKEKLELDEQQKLNAIQMEETKKKLNEAEWHEFGNKDKLHEKLKELNETKKTLDEQETLYAEKKKIHAEEEKRIYDEVGQASEELASKVEAHTSRRYMSLEELDEKERTVAENLKSKYQEISEAATNMFDKISTKSKLSHEEMLENLKHNAKAVDEWATNLEELAKKGVDLGMLEQLRQMGPKSAGYVAELNTLTEDELKEFNKVFEEAGKNAPDNLTKAWYLKNDNIKNGVYELITQADAGLTEATTHMDWSKHGDNVVEGVKKGIEENSKKGEEATRRLGLNMLDSYAQELGIQSPSKKFKEFGVFIIEGLVNGLKSSQNNAVSLAKDIAKNIAQSANNELLNARDSANYAGKMAGIGFNSGLRGTRSRVMATARSIAYSVSKTIRNALSIHSPSRVLEKLGINTGEGFEVGMASKLNAIKKISNDIAQSAIPNINMGEAKKITNNNNGNMNNYNNSNINIEKVEWKGKEDIRKTMEEIGWITGQESWRLQEV
ncbi:tape measure protein [Helcococcus kunzii]|uniref:tape measure protein n=1 Tax=Helcococcus kunzii TaxID=40091 RepID=UPI0038A28995